MDIGSAIFYQDSTGITAKWNVSGETIIVSFDGSTAQVIYSGTEVQTKLSFSQLMFIPSER